MSYGGRGISVSPLWDKFVTFLADMGECPGPGWTLDRINNNGDYRLGNCRWATRKTQAQNRPGYVIGQKNADKIRARYAAGGISQDKLAAIYGVSQATVSKVVRGETWR